MTSRLYAKNRTLNIYNKNAVDIDIYLIDDGGHPNSLGYQMISEMFTNV